MISGSMNGLLTDNFCTSCVVDMDQVLYSFKNGTDSAEISDMLVNMCLSLLIGNPLLCDYFIACVEVTITTTAI